jgi:SSS family transporter
VLFSVVATETSALTFISIPGIAYLGDFTFLQVALGYVIGRIVVAYTLLPRYYQGQLVTAYALLEQRFGLATRRFASVIFMATRAFADSVRVFATAIPIALILSGTVPHPVFWAVLILGLLTVFYTYHGGMRAVVWTDVVQTCVYLVGGVSAIALLGATVSGGWPAIWQTAAAAGKLRVFDLHLGFDRPYTLAAGVIGGAFLSMASHGADQLIVQRLLAAENLRDARRALIGSGFAVLAQFALFLTIGVGLFAYYGGAHVDAPDTVFPGYILQRMPHGLIGLIVAAILAATMSTHSGAINSLAASTTHDIYLPLTGGRADDPGVLRMAKRFTLFWGVLLTGGALLYRQQGTPVVQVALSIASFTYGGLLGGFFLAILWRRAIQRDAITGMTIGIAAMTFIVFAKPLHLDIPAIAWPWYVLIGSTITVLVGMGSSFTHRAP